VDVHGALINQFAWYVQDTYTSKDQNVGVVGHSMGGLVIRYALYRVAAGDPDFPPSLLISNIVNFGSPHSGTNIAALCAASNVECTEMTPGSAFLGDSRTSTPRSLMTRPHR
jgi:triacylglycerol esterase/lipase EstA (alpha/beta hydrolase family)